MVLDIRLGRATRLFKTSIFRLTLYYGALFGVSILALLLSIYWSTARGIENHLTEKLSDEMALLRQTFQAEGQKGLIAAVEELADPGRLGNGLYGMITPQGEIVAGNLASLPQSPPDAGVTWSSVIRSHEGEDEALFRETSLSDGTRLLVGHHLGELDNFRTMMVEAILWAGLGSLLLGAGGGFLASRMVLRRLDALTQGAETIRRGHLAHRMPRDGSQDEFDRLAETLNSMLDQIDTLMSGMRSVANNIAHDLRSPLTRMRAQLERAVVRGGTSEELGETCERVLAEADDLLATFNALLSIAEAEAGLGLIESEEIDLSRLAVDVADLYEPLADEKGITLAVSGNANLKANGSRELLFQALSNLVDNAIKYSHARSHITITWGADPGGRFLEVADTGPGIPDGDHARVRQRFVRLDASRSTPGNGLGLALIDAIARVHGGTLVLANANPGLRARLILPPRPPQGAHP